MRFTDLFIRRPVLASVVSLLILLLGLRAVQDMDLRQYPKIADSTITITTVYPGASAELVKGFISTPIQQAVATAEGIDYLSAISAQSVSTIEAHLQLNFDPDKALTQIMSKVAEVRSILPPEADEPVIKASAGRSVALMYQSYYSTEMTEQQITDYLIRVVQPKLQTIPGVSEAEILGNKTFAMRVWLDPNRMAAHGITPTDVAGTLRANNFISAAGETKGDTVALDIYASTDLHTPAGFGDIVVRKDGATLVRLRDVAEIELGAEDYESSVIFNGERSIFIALTPTPTANPLEMIERVRAAMPDIQRQLPAGLNAKIVYDGSRYISSAIEEVIRTIAEASIIVVIVIFLFLGALRSVVIPVVTIPLSLIGTALIMLALGYSLNLLTLLAMVLAIGLVVDDAIVVVENIHRHIEEGLRPFDAAIKGAREIASPVISMTLTLAAVYAPIGFLTGLTGDLFREFAFSLAGAVIISGIVALTLSPMMCSKLLRPAGNEGRLALWLDRRFERLKNRYQRMLHAAISYRPVTAVFAVIVLVSTYFLYVTSAQELAPVEDQSVIFISATGPSNATLHYMSSYSSQLDGIYGSIPEGQDYFLVNGLGGVNNVISGIILKPWQDRARTQMDVMPQLQEKVAGIAGLSTVAFPLPSLPGGGQGLPVQFVIGSTVDYAQIYEVAQQMLAAARGSGLFIFADSDLKFDSPQISMQIDRDRAGELGISMNNIGVALATMLGGNYVNRFNLEGRSYKVIPQVKQDFRKAGYQLDSYYVRAGDGSLVPLSSVVKMKTVTQPNKLSQFAQLNSATISGVPRPGVSIGRILEFMQAEAAKIFPKGFVADYAGESRQYVTEGSALVYTFFFAIIVIFLVLAAQFESFRDPFIVLVSVPLSLCGALIPLSLGAATVNIYTQIGLVTLIGLISKHGILMVEFANQLQRHEGLSKREAIEQAAAIRLRPILMTTAAMVLGVVPLLLATGAGAVSRFDIGLVISTGMTIGTLFTLFVVPAMYTFFARDHQKEAARLEARDAQPQQG